MILESIQHTARRSRLCACCGLTVHTGERYVRAQVPGGQVVAKKAMHTACYTMRTRTKEGKEE